MASADSIETTGILLQNMAILGQKWTPEKKPLHTDLYFFEIAQTGKGLQS